MTKFPNLPRSQYQKTPPKFRFQVLSKDKSYHLRRSIWRKSNQSISRSLRFSCNNNKKEARTLSRWFWVKIHHQLVVVKVEITYQYPTTNRLLHHLQRLIWWITQKNLTIHIQVFITRKRYKVLEIQSKKEPLVIKKALKERNLNQK